MPNSLQTSCQVAKPRNPLAILWRSSPERCGRLAARRSCLRWSALARAQRSGTTVGSGGSPSTRSIPRTSRPSAVSKAASMCLISWLRFAIHFVCEVGKRSVRFPSTTSTNLSVTTMASGRDSPSRTHQLRPLSLFRSRVKASEMTSESRRARARRFSKVSPVSRVDSTASSEMFRTNHSRRERGAGNARSPLPHRRP